VTGKEVTDWHRVVLWEGLADVASQYLKKGDKVYIEGKLKTRSYEQDGITKYITEVRATNMIMMGKSSGGGSGSYQSQDSYSQPQQSTQKDNYSANNDFDDIDDDGDVPF
jgi:single-strand DNA-binding protein